MLSNTLISECH